MRWLAWLLTPLTLAAAVWAGDTFWLVWQNPLPVAVDGGTGPRVDPLALDVPEPQPPTRWPAVFGTYTPPEPQPPRPPQPVIVEEPMPPAPPIENLGYVLKGVVTNGDNRWAIVSHPTGDRLIRVGDALADGVIVTAIDPDSLRLDNRGNEALLAFQE